MPTKRFDKKTLEDGGGATGNLWRYAVATLGSNDLGLSSDKRRQPDRITRSGR
ncbi:Uncharacterised protein [Escherichia coli]|uniref:Uncharacterized protein n=1 Tax=Escherichia coli TaxID=562 RepID=A0A377D6Q5_ECOLX|nr:Uncharacterised protein [Escherichia coli]